MLPPMPDARDDAPSLRVWIALVIVYIVWGTTYLGIEVVNETMPTFLAAGVRFLVSGAILYAFAVRRGDRTGDRPTRRGWRAAAVIGGGLLVTGNGFVALAERTVPTGLVSLIIALVPIWMALIDTVLLGRRPRPQVIVGLLGGFTTFSAFAVQALRLGAGAPLSAIAYVAASLLLALLAAAAGLAIGRAA